MNYGLYISASAASVNMARQDTAANNLANVNTPGFKPDSLHVRARDVARVEDNLPFEDSDALIERLGAGIMPVPTATSLAQAPLETTNRPLDVGLEGEGFLTVADGPNPRDVRLTRDGRMLLDSTGTLVHASSGRDVLDAQGRRIVLDSSLPTLIRGDGVIEQGGGAVARLGLKTVADPGTLNKAGQGLLAPRPEDAAQLRDATPRVVQGSIEKSGVDPVKGIMAVTGAGRSAQGAIQMMGLINENLDSLINRFARIA
jgi:flagellar basal-body rod protein FlgF